MPTSSTSGIFAAASRTARAVFVVAAILLTDSRASQAFYPCNYESIKTSGRVQLELRSHGRITSPGYPDAFPPCAQGMWSLVARPNCTVLLNFVEFDVANNTDHLFVYETDDAPRVAAQISGEATNRTLQLMASNVQLVFLAQNEKIITELRLSEDGSERPQPRRRFVIDFTSWPLENVSKGRQSAIYRVGAASDALPAFELFSSEPSWKAWKTSKLITTICVSVASVVISAITLGTVYVILWRRTGHLFSYRRFFDGRSFSTAELQSDSATSTARLNVHSSPASSSANSENETDGPKFLASAAGSSVSPCAPQPSSSKATLATASV